MDGQVGKKGLSRFVRLHASIPCRCTYRWWTDLKNVVLVLAHELMMRILGFWIDRFSTELLWIWTGVRDLTIAWVKENEKDTLESNLLAFLDEVFPNAFCPKRILSEMEWRYVTLSEVKNEQSTRDKGYALTLCSAVTLSHHSSKCLLLHSSILKFSLRQIFYLALRKKLFLSSWRPECADWDASQFTDVCRLLQLYHLLLSRLHSQFWKPVDLKSCFMMCLSTGFKPKCSQ